MTKPYDPNDKFFKKAKELGKRARSYFKIQEVDAKRRFLRTGMHVLDLGAAPGSFMQYVIEEVGPKGYVLGVDLSPINPLGGTTPSDTIRGDIFEDSTKQAIREKHPKLFDGVVSDLAPKTSGIKELDQERSIDLSHEVLRHAEEFVKKGGFCLIKVFQGEDFDRLIFTMKKKYAQVKVTKPAACRDRSREVYALGMGRKA